MAQDTRSPEPLKQRSREGVLAFWAGEMGLSVPELLIPVSGVRISIRAAILGALVFRRGEDVRIATADSNVERLGENLPRELGTDFCSPDLWRSVFPELCGSVTGPTRYCYLDAVPKAWAPPPASRKHVFVRGLAASDLKTYAEFAMTLTRAERELSGLDSFGRQVWRIFRRRACSRRGIRRVAEPGRASRRGDAPRFSREEVCATCRAGGFPRCGGPQENRAVRVSFHQRGSGRSGFRTWVFAVRGDAHHPAVRP